jgi:hypothetical protein
MRVLHGDLMRLLRRQVLAMLLLPRRLLHGRLLLVHQLRIRHLLLHVRRQIRYLAARLHGRDLLRVEAAGLSAVLLHALHLRLPPQHLLLPHHALLRVHHLRVHGLRLHPLLVHHVLRVGREVRHGLRAGPAGPAHAWLHAHHRSLRDVLDVRTCDAWVHLHRRAHRLRVGDADATGYGLAWVHAWVARHAALLRWERAHHVGLGSVRGCRPRSRPRPLILSLAAL